MGRNYVTIASLVAHKVTLLHVTHHTSVPFICWLGIKYVPSESAAFMPFANSFVHSIMYAYYGLSTFDVLRHKLRHLKRYLTALQIVQLVAIVAHCMYLVVNAERCRLNVVRPVQQLTNVINELGC